MFVVGIFLLYFGDKLLHKNILAFVSEKTYVGVYATAIITSMPELVVTLYAASIGLYSIAVGALFGSSIALLLLALGLPAIIKSIRISVKTSRKAYILLIVSLIVFALFISDDFLAKKQIVFSHIESIILLMLALTYAYFLAGDVRLKRRIKNVNIVEGISGVILLLLGGVLSVNAVEGLSLTIGISPYAVSVLLLGLGVALPEIIENMLKVEKNIRLIEHNVLLSVIFNIVFILPLASLFFGPIIMSYSQAFDGLLIVAAGIIAFPWSLKKNVEVDQTLGILLVVLYALFSISVIIKAF